MPPKASNKHRHSFEFDYTVSTVGVPQPYPIPPRAPRILFRLSSAEDENGREFSVLNICGNRAGLEYLAAMFVLSADSAKYDPAFHIHLEDMKCVETDLDVTVRAPAYLKVLQEGKFSESKGTPIPLPTTNTTKRARRASAKPKPKT